MQGFRGSNSSLHDLEEFFRMKKKGNRCARRGEFSEAVECYSKCVKMMLPKFRVFGDADSVLDNSLIGTVFSNRAQMFLMMGEYYNSFLDCLSVFESIILRSQSNDCQCLFGTASTEIMIKTRIRISRILCLACGNYPTAYRYLARTSDMNTENRRKMVNADWKKKIFEEMMNVGEKFYKRVHNFHNKDWELQKGFEKFCVNAKRLREIPINGISRRVYEKLENRRFSSFSKNGSKIYIFGGRERDDQLTVHYLNDLLMFDYVAGKIEHIHYQSGDIPFRRSQHKTVIHGSSVSFLYLFGGDYYSLKEKRRLHPFFRLNLETFRWEKLPFPIRDEKCDCTLCLFDHSMVVHNDEMYIFGGCSRLGWLEILQIQEHGTLYSYNFVTKKWKILSKYNHDLQKNAKMPGARFNHAMWKMMVDDDVKYQEKSFELYVFGGCVAEDSEFHPKKLHNKEEEEKDDEKVSFFTYGDLWCFDFEKMGWTPVIQGGCIPSRRTEIDVVVDEKSCKAYLFGGYSYQGLIIQPDSDIGHIDFYTYFGDLYEFSFYNNEGCRNEFFGHDGVLKDLKQCHWRKILYPDDGKKFEERSQVFPFLVGRKMFLWGGYQGGKRKKLLTFWEKLVEITFFKRTGCAHCLKKVEKMKKCSRCGVRYCGRECQRKNWIVHKKVCGK